MHERSGETDFLAPKKNQPSASFYGLGSSSTPTSWSSLSTHLLLLLLPKVILLRLTTDRDRAWIERNSISSVDPTLMRPL